MKKTSAQPFHILLISAPLQINEKECLQRELLKISKDLKITFISSNDCSSVIKHFTIENPPITFFWKIPEYTASCCGAHLVKAFPATVVSAYGVDLEQSRHSIQMPISLMRIKTGQFLKTIKRELAEFKKKLSLLETEAA